MSGIVGFFNIDHEPAKKGDINRMAETLGYRGPDRTNTWYNGAVALGHTLLATMPESLQENQPYQESGSGCVITADVRLDNRESLIEALGLDDKSGSIGDAEILLRGYLDWGESCVKRYIGDFAFSIWDPRQQLVFCARDHNGVREFYYHHARNRVFAFASSPKAILALDKVPQRINEGRVADFLVNILECIDKTSTFFEEIYRLPPGHCLTVTSGKIKLSSYWSLKPGNMLELPSDGDYIDAFLDVFKTAVSARLRNPALTGSMLSGGMDSSSIVAMARQLLLENKGDPLSTFSAISSASTSCNETRAINSVLSMPGMRPTLVDYESFGKQCAVYRDYFWELDEPFDHYMLLPRMMYISAHEKGKKVLLDGIFGDALVHYGSALARLLRAGRFIAAWRNAVAINRFWGGNFPVSEQLSQGLLSAFLPTKAKYRYHLITRRPGHKQVVEDAGINPEFARRIALWERFEGYALAKRASHFFNPAENSVQAISSACQTVGRERYNRVASTHGVEACDPFSDVRLQEFCVNLPDDQRVRNGWPKFLLRSAMKGYLPEDVRWRKGGEHLGRNFHKEFIHAMRSEIQQAIDDNRTLLEPYVDMNALQQSYTSGDYCRGMDLPGHIIQFAQLGVWLRRHSS
jgi:asparagine synthase (glutamine-hydrolysing)